MSASESERERLGERHECGKTTTKAKNFTNSKVNARSRDKHTNNTTDTCHPQRKVSWCFYVEKQYKRVLCKSFALAVPKHTHICSLVGLPIENESNKNWILPQAFTKNTYRIYMCAILWLCMGRKKKRIQHISESAIESERVNEGENVVCCKLRPAGSTRSVYVCVRVFASWFASSMWYAGTHIFKRLNVGFLQTYCSFSRSH